MQGDVFRLIMSEEAKLFIDSLPERAADMMRYNIHRVIKGERNKKLF